MYTPRENTETLSSILFATIVVIHSVSTHWNSISHTYDCQCMLRQHTLKQQRPYLKSSEYTLLAHIERVSSTLFVTIVNAHSIVHKLKERHPYRLPQLSVYTQSAHLEKTIVHNVCHNCQCTLHQHNLNKKNKRSDDSHSSAKLKESC